MDRDPRAIAGKTILALLVVFIILPLPLILGLAGASDSDIPEAVSTKAASRMFVDPEDADKGMTLIAPFSSKSVYLVDNDGAIVHTWICDSNTMAQAKMLVDGTLLRISSETSRQPYSLELLDWDGSELWKYTPPDPFLLHHSFEVLENGNILVNAGVPYTSAQSIDMGRDPDLTPETLYVEPILEIEPDGSNGGEIVWMWDPMDHIVQDFDSGKPNYGIVADHPELLDFNFPREHHMEWQHTNSVRYNAELDQIMITSRNFDELWIIDHSTTTAEAANHTGGTRGRGGDILYRWGNPQAYDVGNDTDHILWGPHDAQWIDSGLPGEGNIIIFNNGQNMYMTRPEGRYSTVEELVPPVNASGDYYLAPGSAYGPSDPIWRYKASPPEAFFGWAMGGVERLPNGNTLVCGGSSGYNIEVDTKGEVVWDYRSSSIFKVSRYYPPALDIVPDLEATEDVILRVDVSSFISDLDTDHEDLVIGENSVYASVSDHELIIQYPDGIETDVINLTVGDGIFEMGREVHVTITPVNDPPLLTSIPLIRVVESEPYLLDLMPFISDPDTAIDQMIITEDSSYVTVEGGALRFLYPNGVLIDRILLVVSDGELEDRTEIVANVTPVNDPPIVGRIPDQFGIEDVEWSIDLEVFIWDIDSSMENISVVSDSRYASVSGLNLTLLYPEGMTWELVILTVSDGESETCATVTVTIEPVNDPPVVGTLPPLTILEDEPTSFDIGQAIYDIDTPKEELTLRVASPFIDVDGYYLILTYPEGVLHDDVDIEIWDGDLHIHAILAVTIEPVNDPPWWDGLPEITAYENVEDIYDLEPNMNDIDTPLRDLAVEVSSDFGSMEGHSFKFVYPDGVLSEQVTFTLTDGEFQVILRINVTISPVNDIPELLGATVDPPTGAAGSLYKFTVIFRDIDIGANEPVVMVVIDGDSHTCAKDEMDGKPYKEGVSFYLEMDPGPGVHRFHFVAEDGDGGEVTTEPLSVAVKDNSDTGNGTDLMTIMMAIGTAVLLAILIMRRVRSSGATD